MLLNLESLQVQGAFLASVVPDAQCDRYVEVVTSPRGFRKSTCVSAMASEDRVLRALFGTASPSVKMVGGKLPIMTSGFKLFDTLLEDLPVIEYEDVEDVVNKVRPFGARIKSVSERLPI